MWNWLSGLGNSIGQGIKKPFDMLGRMGASGAESGIPKFTAPITTPSFNPAAGGGGISASLPTTFKSPVNMPMQDVASGGGASLSQMGKPPVPTMPPLPPVASRGPSLDIPQHPDMVPTLDKYAPNAPWTPEGDAHFRYMTDRMKRDDQGTLTGDYKRNWKDIGRNILLGGLQGVNNRRPGDSALGAFIGGAGTGGITTAVSPRLGAEYGFSQTVAPRFEEQRQREMTQNAAQAAQAKAQAENERIQAQTGMYTKQGEAAKVGAEIKKQDSDRADKKLTYDTSVPKPKVGITSWGTVDTQSGQPIYIRPDKPIAEKPMTAAEAEAIRSDTEGSISQIAGDSLQGRIPQLKEQYLTPAERAFIDGTAKPYQPISRETGGYDGTLTDADKVAAERQFAEDQARAFDKWRRIQDDELRKIEKEVGRNAKVNAQRYRSGRQGKPSVMSKQPSGPVAPSAAEKAKLLDWTKK